MSLKVKKATGKLNSKAGVPADQLDTIHAVRTLGEERKLGQYKLVDGDKVRYFNNFKELRFHSNLVLRNQHKHVIIVKGEIPDDPC
jgi:hypothetical protein